MKRKHYAHIEYQFPKIRKKEFWGRIAVLISSYIIAIAFFVFLYIKNKEHPEIFFIAFITFPFACFGLFWLTTDYRRFFKSLISSYQAMSKIVLTREGISIMKGRTVLKSMKWKDIEIIEKMVTVGETQLIFITNILKERVIVLEEKKKNFIIIPSRSTIDEAVRRFSGREITLADPSINRFIMSDKFLNREAKK